jgi:hypothetical protein
MIGTPSGLPSYTLPPGTAAHPSGSTTPPGSPARYTAPPSHTPGSHPLFDKPSSGAPAGQAQAGHGPQLSQGASAIQGTQPHQGTPANQPVSAGSAPAGAPFGVGASGGSRPPFGGSPAPASAPPSRPSTDGNESSAVPQQRGQGTVYGAPGPYSSPDMTMPVNSPDMTMPVNSPIDMTMPVNMNPVENSGSLTGHILSQGWDQGADTHRRSNVKVGIAMLIVLLALVGISLLFLATAGSAFSDWINGIFKG